VKILFSVLAVVIALWGGLIFFSPVHARENPKNAQVVAYYFHGTFRCATCRNLERYSKEAIETNFKNALAAGKLTFKAVNVEDKGNEHYSNDYQLYTKSLILSLVKEGKQVRWKNLDKIWEYVGNKKRYTEYVKTNVEELLKEAL